MKRIRIILKEINGRKSLRFCSYTGEEYGVTVSENKDIDSLIIETLKSKGINPIMISSNGDNKEWEALYYV